MKWLPFLGWMGLIFFLSHQSFDPPEEPTPWYIKLLETISPVGLDKVVHFGLYSILALLGSWPLGRRPILLLFICVAYGVFDEWHQSFVPTRHPDVWDLLADGLGALSAIVAFQGFARYRKLNLDLDSTPRE